MQGFPSIRLIVSWALLACSYIHLPNLNDLITFCLMTFPHTFYVCKHVYVYTTEFGAQVQRLRRISPIMQRHLHCPNWNLIKHKEGKHTQHFDETVVQTCMHGPWLHKPFPCCQCLYAFSQCLCLWNYPGCDPLTPKLHKIWNRSSWHGYDDSPCLLLVFYSQARSQPMTKRGSVLFIKIN